MSDRYNKQARKYRNDLGRIKDRIKSSGKITANVKSNIIKILTTVNTGIDNDRKSFKENSIKVNLPYELPINSKNFIRVSQMDNYLTRMMNAGKRINDLRSQKKVNQDEIARLMRALEKASNKTEETKLKKLLQEEKNQMAERNRTINEIQRQRQQNDVQRIEQVSELRQQLNNAKVNQKALKNAEEKIKQQEKNLKNSQNALTAFKSSKAFNANTIRNLTRQLNNAKSSGEQSKISSLQNQLSKATQNLRRMKSLETKVEQSEKELEEIVTAFNAIAKNRNKLTEELANSKKEIAISTDNIKELQSKINKGKGNANTLTKLKNALMKKDKELKNAIEAGKKLGSPLNQIVKWKNQQQQVVQAKSSVIIEDITNKIAPLIPAINNASSDKALAIVKSKIPQLPPNVQKQVSIIAKRVANKPKNIKVSNAYKMLSLNPNVNVTKKQIITAFRQLALKYHPNKGGDRELFNKITKAKEILLDHIDGTSPQKTEKIIKEELTKAIGNKVGGANKRKERAYRKNNNNVEREFNFNNVLGNGGAASRKNNNNVEKKKKLLIQDFQGFFYKADGVNKYNKIPSQYNDNIMPSIVNDTLYVDIGLVKRGDNSPSLFQRKQWFSPPGNWKNFGGSTSKTWGTKPRKFQQSTPGPNNRLKNIKKTNQEVEMVNLKKVNQPTLNKKQVEQNIRKKILNLKGIAGKRNAPAVRRMINNSNLSNANKNKLRNNINKKLGF